MTSRYIFYARSLLDQSTDLIQKFIVQKVTLHHQRLDLALQAHLFLHSQFLSHSHSVFRRCMLELEYYFVSCFEFGLF